MTYDITYLIQILSQYLNSYEKYNSIFDMIYTNSLGYSFSENEQPIYKKYTSFETNLRLQILRKIKMWRIPV